MHLTALFSLLLTAQLLAVPHGQIILTKAYVSSISVPFLPKPPLKMKLSQPGHSHSPYPRFAITLKSPSLIPRPVSLDPLHPSSATL